MEVLRGQIASVRPIRDGWGTCTLLHGSEGERAAVVGTVLGLREGDTVEAEGAWSNHPRWGRQFRARRLEVVAPSDAAGAVEWCRARLPGVGRKLATAMVERWGVPGLWAVLGGEHDVGGASPLVTLRGITPERAVAIVAAYREHLAERDLMVELRGFGLTDGQCAAVVARYGDAAGQALREDPYRLIGEVHGFGWKRADALAMRMGLPGDHPSRLRACVEYMLDEAAGAGHCYVPAVRLVSMVARELGVEARLVRSAANRAVDARRVVVSKGRAYRADIAAAEASVAECVARLRGVA